MAARGGRRGPAPIASFDHDVSDEVRPAVGIFLSLSLFFDFERLL